MLSWLLQSGYPFSYNYLKAFAYLDATQGLFYDISVLAKGQSSPIKGEVFYSNCLVPTCILCF